MRSLATIFVLTILVTLSAIAQEPEPRVPAANPQFNALKTLAGEWIMAMPDGKTASQTYRVVSGDSAILLDTNVPGESNMITMFNPDGQRTVATHYCSMGNQPRMVSSGTDTKNIAFKFKDVTNDDGKSGSMRDLTIVLVDKDHHNQIWTWQDAKGKQQVETFKFTRAASSAPGQ
jgi:hypothetical protein